MNNCYYFNKNLSASNKETLEMAYENNFTNDDTNRNPKFDIPDDDPEYMNEYEDYYWDEEPEY